MDHKLAALRVCKAVKLGKLFRISLRHFGLCVGRLIIYLWLLPLCDLFQVYRARCFLSSFYASWAELWLIATNQAEKGEALKGFTQMLQRQFSSDYKELRFKRSLISNYQMQLPAAPVCQWISAVSILESNLESESAHCPSSRWLMTERRRHRVNYGICIHNPKNCKQLWTDRSLTSSASFHSWDKHQNGANNK